MEKANSKCPHCFGNATLCKHCYGTGIIPEKVPEKTDTTPIWMKIDNKPKKPKRRKY
jgi:hypothetical protein